MELLYTFHLVFHQYFFSLGYMLRLVDELFFIIIIVVGVRVSLRTP
jgi:hypothetical protein